MNCEFRPSKKQVAGCCSCGGLLGCRVAPVASQNRSQVIYFRSWFPDCFFIYFTLQFQGVILTCTVKKPLYIKKHSLSLLTIWKKLIRFYTFINTCQFHELFSNIQVFYISILKILKPLVKNNSVLYIDIWKTKSSKAF